MKKTANIFITDLDSSCNDKSFEYLLGFQPSLGGMVLTKNTLDIILDNRYFSKVEKIDELNIKNILGKQKLKINYINSRETIGEIIKVITNEKNGITEVILEGQIATSDSEKIEKALDFKPIILEKGEGYFKSSRIIKNNNELKKINTAIKIIDKTFIHIVELNKRGELKGKTELEIRGIIINKIFEFGGTGESFGAIIAFGKNSAIPHHDTGTTIIEDGVLLIDMGVIFDGYCSDFTRTLWVGEENELFYKFTKIHKIVKEAHLNAFKKAQSGMKGKEIDNLTRTIIEDYGYGKYFTHTTGHGVGLDIHESPKIGKESDNIIENGMVFTIEPGIYLKGEFGVRLEDIVILKNGKLIKYSNIDL